MPRFKIEQKVLFQHCDPAHIVFYPRYFEMINATVEQWFDDALDYSFAKMHHDNKGIPTLKTECEFLKPSYLGDVLQISLLVTHIGKTSFHCHIDMHCGDQHRLSCQTILVYIDTKLMKPVPLSDDIVAIMQNFT